MGRDILSIKEILKHKIKIFVVIDNNNNFKDKFFHKYSKEINKKKIEVININKRVGINKLRYYGAKKTNSKYILFVDDDDNIDAKKLLKTFNDIEKKNVDLIISNYKFIYKNKSKIISPLIKLFGKYSPFVKTITPGGGTIYNKKIIKNLKKYDFNRFEDWCIGILLVYKLKKKYLLNKNIFYHVNYKKKYNKDFWNTLKFRFNFSKKFGLIALFHSTSSYFFTQIFIKIFK